ncbi:DUF1642 domain-containing protein [Lacticaseibacillus casei]|uniref:DUF1642 domain-containing protein n=1 Tax=Lacticaseibacillus casei TaxID=1582 RepID=UPI00141A65CF|nr:DUF1642 domain-containing protein [Lacticaseibacillus casei]NIG82731.1 DUF1642 domain-containing protein [Lacticaseibacillus casei]
MSEEKLYAVKNDEGEWLDQDHIFGPGAWATPDKDEREKVAKCYGGHVVALVEEPKKVVLTEEQAEIVEGARDSAWPANYISGNGANEELLMNAYVNGYTVAKEKKYNVKVPHAEGWHFQKYSSASKLGVRNNWRPFPAKDIDSNMSKDLFIFTESEIEHYGLQDCEKEEVTDDGIR